MILRYDSTIRYRWQENDTSIPILKTLDATFYVFALYFVARLPAQLYFWISLISNDVNQRVLGVLTEECPEELIRQYQKFRHSHKLRLYPRFVRWPVNLTGSCSLGDQPLPPSNTAATTTTKSSITMNAEENLPLQRFLSTHNFIYQY
jgi:hypothetical protein